MDSLLFLIIATIILEDLEEMAFQPLPCVLKFYFRCINDIILAVTVVLDRNYYTEKNGTIII